MKNDPFQPEEFGFVEDSTLPGHYSRGTIGLEQTGDFVTIWAQTLEGDYTTVFAGWIKSNGMGDVLFALFLPLDEYDLTGLTDENIR